MSEVRERLQKILQGQYNVEQLDGIVKRSLEQPLEDFAILTNRPAIVGELLDQLEKETTKLIRFLLFLQRNKPKPELRAAIDEYLDELSGTSTPRTDPYVEMVVFGEPFIDRQSFRADLRAFFNGVGNSVFSTQGLRYSGRSHARYFIQYVADFEGLEVVYIDPIEDVTVQDIIDRLINEMQLPFNDFRDRMAQAPSKTKGFVSTLAGYSRNFQTSGKNWCIVFDHHDRAEITPDVKEYMETMIMAALQLRLRNIRIILLGRGNWSTLSSQLSYQVTDGVTFSQLGPPDVLQWLQDQATKKGETLTVQQLQSRRDGVFMGLPTPLDLAGMQTMCNRLRAFI